MHFWRIMLSGRQYKIYKLRCAPQFVSWYLMKWAIFHKYKLIFSQPSRILSLRNAGENKKTPGRKIQAMMTKAVRRSFCGTQQAVFRWKDALKDLCGGILTMADSVLFSGIIPGSCQIFLAWRSERPQRKERQKNSQLKNLFITVLPASKAAADSAISEWILTNPDVTAPAAYLSSPDEKSACCLQGGILRRRRIL